MGRAFQAGKSSKEGVQVGALLAYGGTVRWARAAGLEWAGEEELKKAQLERRQRL